MHIAIERFEPVFRHKYLLRSDRDLPRCAIKHQMKFKLHLEHGARTYSNNLSRLHLQAAAARR
jgi:hypothetical protein